MENLQNGYQDDPEAKILISELSAAPLHSNSDGYSLTDGLLR
jgi:hypothetical protein